MALTEGHQESQDDAIRLCYLPLTCFAFDAITHYSSSLEDFRRRAALPVNLADSKHRDALLDWLNAWRTRMPARVFESAELEDWHCKHEEALPPAERHLWHLSDEDIRAAESAYRDLCSQKGWGGGTAASKVLFAVRPNALPPWDDATRKELRRVLRDPNAAGHWRRYGMYLEWCREQACSLKSECKLAGFDIGELPCRLNQPKATVAMLINEHIWVRYAKNKSFPTPADIRQWASWGQERVLGKGEVAPIVRTG